MFRALLSCDFAEFDGLFCCCMQLASMFSTLFVQHVTLLIECICYLSWCSSCFVVECYDVVLCLNRPFIA